MSKKKNLSQKDKKTWEDYIKDPSDIYDKDKNNQNIARKERYKFDLHGFTLDEANKKVKEILLFCTNNKYEELLLITGNGLHSSGDKDVYTSKDFGKLKFSVPEFIRTDLDIKSLIVSINVADEKDGGEGAILIKLKNL